MISPDSSDPEPFLPGKNRRRFLIYLAYSALLCLIFAFLGFPKPHVDDPFYVGTAEHLAKTGELYNPNARNWMAPFTPGKFLAQFPLYPFVLGTWMKTVGYGVSSVLAFFALSNFLTCLFAACFLRRARLPDALLIFLPWMILSLSQTQGFRSDLPGFCAFWISAFCVTFPRPAHYFLAAIFASAAILLWPVMLGLVCPLFALYFLAHSWNLPVKLRSAWMIRQSIALLAGGAAAFLAFLAMIRFEWQAFCHDFLLMTSMRRPGGNSILEAFLGLSWVRYNHLFLCCAALLGLLILYWVLRPGPRLSFHVRIWLIETALGCLLAILLYAVNTNLIFFFFWMAFFTVAAEFIRTRARKEMIVLVCLSPGLFLQLAESAKNLKPVHVPETAGVAEELKNQSGSTIVFDEVAYRYLFNLQPPASSLSWLCLRPAPELGGTLDDKKDDQVWVMLESRAYPDSKINDDKIILIK